MFQGRLHQLRPGPTVLRLLLVWDQEPYYVYVHSIDQDPYCVDYVYRLEY